MTFPGEPGDTAWPVEIADSTLHTIHNLQLVDMDGDGRDEIVVAAWEGVFVLDRDPAGHWSKTRIGAGNQEAKPFKGASEVKVGHLLNSSPFIATIEPWHGFQVVVYTAPKRDELSPYRRRRRPSLWSRQVIAEPVQWGHAVWCADLDSDGDDELIIGQRDPNKPGAIGPKGPGVFVFDVKHGTGLAIAFDRHTIDDGGMACEDALAADLDGDGRIDIIAGGRATHNVKIYWNRQITGQWSVVSGQLLERSFLMSRQAIWSDGGGAGDRGELRFVAAALGLAQASARQRRRARPIPRSTTPSSGPTSRLTSRSSSLTIERFTRGDTRSSRHWG